MLRDVPVGLGPSSKLDRFVEVADKITETVQTFASATGQVRSLNSMGSKAVVANV
jgi:hypothetical protein